MAKQKKIIVLAKENVLLIGEERLEIKKIKGSWYFEDQPLRFLLRKLKVNPLKAILIEKDITQKQLADECSIQTYQISHLCQIDNDKDILLSTIVRLHEFLKEPVEQIFSDRFSEHDKCKHCKGDVPEEFYENVFLDAFCSEKCIIDWKKKFKQSIKDMIKKDNTFMLDIEKVIEQERAKHDKRKKTKEEPSEDTESTAPLEDTESKDDHVVS